MWFEKRKFEKKVCKLYTEWGDIIRQIPVVVPPTMSSPVLQAITGQQSTTALQLSCPQFLIKSKRCDPSKTLFAFQATRVIVFMMNMIKMYEKWWYHDSLAQIIKGIPEKWEQISFFPFSLPLCLPNTVTIRAIIVIRTWIIQRCEAVSAVPSRQNQYGVWLLHRGRDHYKF